MARSSYDQAPHGAPTAATPSIVRSPFLPPSSGLVAKSPLDHPGGKRRRADPEDTDAQHVPTAKRQDKRLDNGDAVSPDEPSRIHSNDTYASPSATRTRSQAGKGVSKPGDLLVNDDGAGNGLDHRSGSG